MVLTIKLTYRKGSKPIIMQTDKKTIPEISEDCAGQLARKYQEWRNKTGNPISKQSLKRYEIGQKYLLLEKLKEKSNELSRY